MEEPARVWRDRLEVAALRLGVERAERQRRLARSRHAREDDERVARNLEADVLEVVFAGTAQPDEPGRLMSSEVPGHYQFRCKGAADGLARRTRRLRLTQPSTGKGPRISGRCFV